MGKQQAKQTIFYHDKPLFGLDIGKSSLKVMQINGNSRTGGAKLTGYGTISFDPSAIENGVIEDPEAVAAALKQLFAHQLNGDISTRRVALTIPSYRTFTRAINLPRLKPSDLAGAVETEVERYTPLPLVDLYLDYEVIGSTSEGQDLLAVAIPKKIVDSYMLLSRLVNLEPILIETTMHAAAQIISEDSNSDVPAMIIDFGSLSSDISLCANGKILVMGTVQGGGDNFTHTIEKSLKVSFEAAGLIKNKYGLGVSKKQAEITEALEPTLAPILKEIHRMLRYYEERFPGEKPVNQIVILGGGANMPGLGDYLTSSLRLPVRTFDPWRYFDSGHLQPPARDDKQMFSTVAGLSFTRPSEVFA